MVRLIVTLTIGYIVKIVLIKPPIPLEKIADAISNADLGIVPERKDSFGNEAFSTKIFEFMSLGVPLIASDTKIDKYCF